MTRSTPIRRPKKPAPISKSAARAIWLRAQRLDAAEPFGAGPQATPAAIEHLGYVQIDTIHVIERSHHHILFTRIPSYEHAHLQQAQSVDKSVFEYWTHALSYVPTKDICFFLPAMKRYADSSSNWYKSVTPREVGKVVSRIRRHGALTIRDIDDDVLVDKDHAWASRKPSKRALQLAFFTGRLAIAERHGMVKSYELIERHFGWEKRPRPLSEAKIDEYMLERALRSKGIVSLDSICHLQAARKPQIRHLIDRRVRARKLVPVAVEGAGRTEHWATPETLDLPPSPDGHLVHVLSPFDPLVIQRKRLKLFFGYDHLFEAYVPRDKRRLGYFALPVLHGDEIVAAIDCKTDRQAGKLLIQQWTWIGRGEKAEHGPAIDEALHRFEKFQLAATSTDN
ncbi:MAG: YcaQ family DNA glycosylase [Nitratireductor sp.]|nr:YcaQ family DNA glycosylase [Nitratireductor sp.]